MYLIKTRLHLLLKLKLFCCLLRIIRLDRHESIQLFGTIICTYLADMFRKKGHGLASKLLNRSEYDSSIVNAE